MTVRGMDVWGHHLNLIAYAFAPFYRWFGAGPEFLYVVQNVSIALGALPVYLIAKRRAGGSARWFAPYVGLAFAAAYLLYAPTQFIAWINFHPEAMVITPFLFAWYFATLRRWGWFFTFVVVALAMREDTALAVIMLGIVLLVVNRHSDYATARRPDGAGDDRPRDRLVRRGDAADHPPLQRRRAALLPQLLLPAVRRQLLGHRAQLAASPELGDP